VNIIGSTSMELRWKLDCSDRIGSVLGFRIFYCPVVSINNSACKGKNLFLIMHWKWYKVFAQVNGILNHYSPALKRFDNIKLICCAYINGRPFYNEFYIYMIIQITEVLINLVKN